MYNVHEERKKVQNKWEGESLIRGNLSVSDVWESKYCNLIIGNLKLSCLVINSNI